MFITKSLFVEFINNPKLAWRHTNDKKTYNKIGDLLYGAMDGVAIGQEVEDAVLEVLGGEKTDVDTSKISFRNRHQSYHNLTEKALKNKPEILYQAGFLLKSLFVKTDILKLNENGQYDLIEVKSKNNIRTKDAENSLLEDLQADISLQDFVLRNLLGDLYSGQVFLAYLNKDYTKDGDIDYKSLIKIEGVSEDLMDTEILKTHIITMYQDLKLNQVDFETKYPYSGENFIAYFGQEKPENSVRKIPRIGKKVLEVRPQKENIEDLTVEDIEILKDEKGQDTRSSLFVKLRQQGSTVINKENISTIFQEKLKFPLYFYDYETISRPVPILDKTKPWQQVVVQYSVHKIEENGQISHSEYLIDPQDTNNQKVLENLVQDLDHGKGSYIVWYKGFENTRNSEMAEMFPEFADDLNKINQNTFDLMEIFSELEYFDRRFQGSSSIKKVLPVLTELSYDDMEVSNGGIATDLLRNMIQGSLENPDTARKNLLEYCKQDTRAMVRIWQELELKIAERT